MYSKILTLMTLAGLATAEYGPPNNVKRQIVAQSVPTAEFKARFEQSGIVPEVIAALDPSVSFYAAYNTVNRQPTLLVPGSTLTISEAIFPFEFSVESLANATGVTVNTKYLIYLLDCDAPSRNDPSARNLRHYLAGNYSLSSLRSSVLPSAQRLFLPTQDAFPFTPFQQPNPQPNTGIHRFIYALYTMPDNFRTSNFDSVGMPTETANWNLAEWRMQLGLGPAIGATFFSIDTNQNNGQGISGQLNTQAGDASGGRVPLVLAALSAVGLALALM